MNPARLLVALSLCLAPAFAAYNYDYSSLLNPYNSAWWANNGTGNSISTNFYTNGSSTGGSLIFNSGTPLPAPSYNYEVKTTLTLTASGGYYVIFLRATAGSMLTPGNNGAFYAVELANPTFINGVCSGTLTFYKQTGANQLTTLASTTVACHNGMGGLQRQQWHCCLHRQPLHQLVLRQQPDCQRTTRRGRDCLTDGERHLGHSHRPSGHRGSQPHHLANGGNVHFSDARGHAN